MSPVVLFVDDEVGVTDAVRVALRKMPFEVRTANSGRDGLAALAAGDVDVVVSDERMPQMTGTEFLARVREEHPDVQRIILTGEASLEATISAINDAAIHRFLVKPCPSDVLVEAINDALAAGRASRSVDVDPGLEEAFEEALGFCRMVYQPIVALPAGRVFAYEALIRVDHPVIASPPDLIHAATQLDRRFDLDRLVRHMVATDMPSAPDDVAVFVNLLPESLEDPMLIEGRDELAPHRDRIVLEITERAPLSMISDVETRLDALRRLGYRLALDDLGAGYAGLTSLATMQPDIVKFDMELVRDIHVRSTQSTLVQSMIVVCRDLGSITLAEGVESHREIDHLVNLGCELFQGYALSKPEPPFVSLPSIR
ncbi:MAG: EAL domain-containing protein [Acidimicrobiales bacterium]